GLPRGPCAAVGLRREPVRTSGLPDPGGAARGASAAPPVVELSFRSFVAVLRPLWTSGTWHYPAPWVLVDVVASSPRCCWPRGAWPGVPETTPSARCRRC